MGTVKNSVSAKSPPTMRPFRRPIQSRCARVSEAGAHDTRRPGQRRKSCRMGSLRKWTKPFLTTFSNSDPITRGGEKLWQESVPGAQGQEHTIIRNAGHFLQEDKGEELAEVLMRFIARGTGACP